VDSFLETVNSSEFQRTIKQPVEVSGNAFRWFSGRTSVRFLPSDTQGIVFKSNDGTVAVAPENVAFDEKHCTTLQAGQAGIRETEHVLSAVYGLGITNLVIELDGVPEPPIMDGSAQPFVEALLRVGIVETSSKKMELRVTKGYRFSLPSGDAFIEVQPSNAWSVFMRVAFPPPIDEQSFSLEVTPGRYADEISFARPPLRCSVEETTPDQLREWFIGYEQNQAAMIMYSKREYLSALRAPDEIVRHKILDFIGDLANVGMPIRGAFSCFKVGHKINGEFVKLFL